MPKRIILLLDGTWNDIDVGLTDTNIVRMRELISRHLVKVSGHDHARHDEANGGVRNCQTDNPAARATTSSILRDRFRNAIIDPKRTANGKACSATVGVLRNDRAAKSIPLACWESPERRSSSIRSTA